ncbi:hypothetical protein E4Q08_09300 [Candidatus Accumulibacter phosphatis]|uniref:Uncharacterized protein n=1 Tax=Candidatus Accumulibacter contiguus TaxID=2954381 RepID=A0ABX1TAN9_9PROT|nr:hypothetical protein [Candidatus Accumulibacter contiguus]
MPAQARSANCLTRLEQRIGRIKRFGQVRSTVDMLNLVHQGTVDERVYERLSQRMHNRFFHGNATDEKNDTFHAAYNSHLRIEP